MLSALLTVSTAVMTAGSEQEWDSFPAPLVGLTPDEMDALSLLALSCLLFAGAAAVLAWRFLPLRLWLSSLATVLLFGVVAIGVYQLTNTEQLDYRPVAVNEALVKHYGYRVMLDPRGGGLSSKGTRDYPAVVGDTVGLCSVYRVSRDQAPASEVELTVYCDGLPMLEWLVESTRTKDNGVPAADEVVSPQ